MARTHSDLLAALALGVGLLASGCARQQEALLVNRAVPILYPCEIADDDEAIYGRGTVDLSFDTPYFVAFELKNNLREVGADKSSTGTEASEMFVESVDVELTTPQDDSVANAVDAELRDFYLPLATTSFDGQDTLGVFVEVPQATMGAFGDAMAAEYDADVRLTMLMTVVFHAVRASNAGANNVGEIDSREFSLPVDLCFDCLRDCAACSGTCDDREVGDGICGAAQDGPVVPASCAATMPP